MNPGTISLIDLHEVVDGTDIICSIRRKNGAADAAITYSNVSLNDHNMIASHLALAHNVTIKSRVLG
jgi:hypothetical protein